MSTVLAVEPKRTQVTVARDQAGRLVDSGQWRVAGVTHWHLVQTEWRMFDRDRFDNDRVAQVRRQRPNRGIARTPLGVARWRVVARWTIYANAGLSTRVDWRASEEIAFWSAMRGEDSHGLARMSDERIARLDTYAMTAAQCRCDGGDAT